jgi:hypothetical protein
MLRNAADFLLNLLYFLATASFCKHYDIDTSPFPAIPVGELSRVSPVVPGRHTSFFYLSGHALGAPFSIHVEDYHLGSLNFLHAGAPKVWLIIELSATPVIEQLLHAYAAKLWGQKWVGQP